MNTPCKVMRKILGEVSAVSDPHVEENNIISGAGVDPAHLLKLRAIVADKARDKGISLPHTAWLFEMDFTKLWSAVNNIKKRKEKRESVRRHYEDENLSVAEQAIQILDKYEKL